MDHVRNRHASPPFIPGNVGLRYQWADRHDWAEQIVRERMQEGGPGLFVLVNPLSGWREIVEAYYPDEIRGKDYREPKRVWIENSYDGGHYVTLSDRLDPFQYSDFKIGNLVALERFDDILLEEDDVHALVLRLRRGNRRTRRYFEKGSAHARGLEIRERKEAQQEAYLDRYMDTIDDIAEKAVRYNPYI
jgi:hypothetical protein